VNVLDDLAAADIFVSHWVSSEVLHGGILEAMIYLLLDFASALSIGR
jgi:hypothetical protein